MHVLNGSALKQCLRRHCKLPLMNLRNLSPLRARLRTAGRARRRRTRAGTGRTRARRGRPRRSARSPGSAPAKIGERNSRSRFWPRHGFTEQECSGAMQEEGWCRDSCRACGARLRGDDGAAAGVLRQPARHIQHHACMQETKAHYSGQLTGTGLCALLHAGLCCSCCCCCFWCAVEHLHACNMHLMVEPREAGANAAPSRMSQHWPAALCAWTSAKLRSAMRASILPSLPRQYSCKRAKNSANSC